MHAVVEAVNDALLQQSSSVLGQFLVAGLLPNAQPVNGASQPSATLHETFLIVPAGDQHMPLELHIDNCHRRCVAFYDTQRVVQFGA